MPNLVGIGNSQVPTNAMLGDLAYQDSVGEINLEKIKTKTSTSGTAKDIFVYNTRKDSDGGAWRKRATTQSWYNEGVSKTRGARKEFPAVAVIVVQASQVTIYDGDDPNFSLWMRFTQSTTQLGAMVGYTGATITCCTMLNGVLMVGLDHSATQGNVSGLRIINFISERFDWKANIAGRNSNQPWPIIDRNGGRPFGFNDGELITDEYIIDVAATVLPNTPVDKSTGLPNPTIAIATKQSLSIIKHDRRVTNKVITNSDTDIGKIDFTFDGNILGTRNDYNYSYITTIGGSATSNAYPSQFSTNIHYFRDNGTQFPPPYSPAGGGSIGSYGFQNLVKSTKGRDFAQADVYGLNLFSIDENLPTTNNSGANTPTSTGSLVAYITKNWNTGYMIGDIRGAYLADTTAETMNESSYTNLITNGSDWTGASGTTAPNGWTSFGHAESAFTIDSGRLKIGNGASNNSTAMHQNVTTVVGTTYTLYFNYELHSSAQYLIFRAGTATLNGSLGYFYGTSTSDVQSTITFVATGTSTNISVQLQATSGNAYAWVDTVYVKAIGAADRFVTAHDSLAGSSANGLAVKGTVTKTPVATGAELVAYTGFSGSNYLLQPYTADLEFTDTMMIMLWVKGWVGSDSLLHRGPGTNRNQKTSFHLYCSYDHNYRLTLCSTTLDGSGNTIEQTFEIPLDGSFLNSSWQHLCFSLSNGIVRGFLNGQEKTLSGNSFTGTSIFSQSTHKNGLWVGTGPVGGAADTASIALLRFSKTVPSARQVKKIYDDEKCLFHENAKCTLYGTSDDVNAIAYDDSNDILHVGTSSGRSDFRGLNRINNTTTAVTSAISASDGLIVEQ